MANRNSKTSRKIGARRTGSNVVQLKLVDEPIGSETRELLSALFATRTEIKGLCAVAFYGDRQVQYFSTGVAIENPALAAGHVGALQLVLLRRVLGALDDVEP